ncbi:flagellin [Sulfurimonas aquatica]|uniref:Flagellin n=1 Tax=Sulfurimonas aquatica TaxID=2672570 RepID=A0A975GBR5_9BACT|nr:flagellin [Sulfurimonas aquatica]QSZ40732.1 flagellin [Sulfurimonas aquatica]
MGFRINTNVAAMNAHRNASNNNVGLDKSLSALSSGLRITKAADDSSGLAIANKLSAQSNGLGQAIRNANDGIGLIQTADGALDEYGNILNRIRTLAVQGANDTQDSDSRAFIGKEMLRLQSELTHIATETKFNGKALLATTATYTFQVGAFNGDVSKTVISNVALASMLATAMTASAGHGTATAAFTQAEFAALINGMDSAISTVDTIRATLGAAQNQLESTVRNISVTQVNVKAAESQIRDVDFAAESANFAKHNILAQSGSYAMSQANAVQQNVLRLLQ